MTSMPKPNRLAFFPLLALAALLLPAAAGAERGTPISTPTASPQKTPGQQAADNYNRGLAMQEKAWELEEKAAGADGAERAKLKEKAEKLYAKAIREFTSATELNPRLHQAWNGLGYCLRKTGDYAAALRAYDRSLELAPNYWEAIEYRGEAYLGLDRIEDAKAAYMKLFGADRAKADSLLAAMQRWVEARRASPGGVDPAAVDGFAAWVAERAELAAQTAAVGGQAGSW